MKKSQPVEFLIGQPSVMPSKVFKKPVISIGNGLLKIQSSPDTYLILTVEQAKELLEMLPGLISILEPLCSGNGCFRFGAIP